MYKNVLTLTALLITMLTFIACGSDEDIINEQQQSVGTKTYTMTVQASKSGDNKALARALGSENTRALALDGKMLNATWTAGDKVEVYDGVTLLGELTAQNVSSDGSTCVLRSDQIAAPSGSSLTLKYLSPDYSTQDGTLTGTANSIDKVCDYAEATVTVSDVSGGNITLTEESADFVNQQAIVKFNLKDIVSGNPSISATELTVTAGETTITVTPAAETSTLFVAIPGISGQAVSLSANITPCYVYTYERPSVTFANSKYYEIAVKMTKQYADLSRVTSNFTAVDGDELRGTLGSNVKISIAAGATVTLSNATIDRGSNYSWQWAGLNCLGDATIILADGTINTVKGFYEYYPGIHIPKDYTLTIQGAGTLNASSNGRGAAIGGGWDIDCGNIIINHGTVNATGGYYSAGIGCGGTQWNSPSCGNITINGGTVTSTGGSRGAGIGCTCTNGTCGDITITGGTVEATGGTDAAGIGGGGYNGNCGDIIISDGVVTATSVGEGAAAIGGGRESACGKITISGGTITANGGYKGVGIGGGNNDVCGDILISGGTVTAAGGYWRAGIGAGYYSTNGTITIKNTVNRVTASKGENAEHSIGISYNNRGSCGTVTIGGVTGTISTSPYTYIPGAISGKFGVSSTKQVYFSQGNLQYNKSTSTWSFMEHQYSTAETNGDVGTNYANQNIVSLFCWGTSGYNHGATCYQPWSTSNTPGDYYAYGSTTYHLYSQSGQADWGYNAISNGGNTQNSGWRTLTKDEWTYLLTERTTSTLNGTANARCARATVAGINGFLIFPDNVGSIWNTSTMGGYPSDINHTSEIAYTWGTDTYTATQFAAMNNAGIVFLPTAGNRQGTTVSQVGTYGGYWIGTSDGGNNDHVYNIYFRDNKVNPASSWYRYEGRAVRLVRDAN